MYTIKKIDYHIEYKFNSVLNKYIDCIWCESFFDLYENKNKPQLIVPDNSIELIFTCSPIKRTLPNGNNSQSYLSHLSGLKTKPQFIELSESPLLSVRFKPHGLFQFTKVNISETVDESLSPIDLFGKEILELEEKLFESPHIENQISTIESFFMNKLIDQQDLCFELLLDKIEKSGGNISISFLAKKFNISVKTIERKFVSNLGITPKKYIRLVRIIQSLKMKNFVNTNNLSGIAHNNGFFDQMHFIKEVKEFTGLTPKNYFNLDRGIQQPIFSD